MHDTTKIEMKIEEELKPLKEICDELISATKSEIKSGIQNVDTKEFGDVADAIKDFCEAKEKVVKTCYYKYILSQMEKSEEEDKEQEKYMLQKFKEEMGEEEGKRFYDSWRHADGTFARKGTGEYRPRSYYRRGGRRGYEEMPYMMMPEMYDPEYYRDMDRMAGKMYYSGSGSSGGSYSGNSGGNSYSGNSGGNSGGNSSGDSRGYSGGGSSSSGNGSSSGGGSRGYSEGYNDGEESGYQRGYSEGNRDGRRNNSGNSSRYDRARRGYEESKGKNGNSQEGNSENMRNLEKLLNIIGEDVKEFTPDMSQSEKAMARQKIDAMAKSIS